MDPESATRNTRNGRRLERASDQAITWLVLALVTAAAISPVLLVPIPAIADYPNNLARMYIIVASGTPNASPYYELSLALVPNIAIDLLVPVVAHLVSVEVATKAFFVLSELMIITGAVAIELALKRKHELAGFLALTTLYSTPFSVGLMNFEFGLGIALWGIAAWIAFENRTLFLRFTIHSLLVFSLFAAHFLALGVYGAAIGLYELHRIATEKSTRTALLTIAMLATPALIALVLMGISGGAIGSGSTVWMLSSKLTWICCSLNGYSVAFSSMSIAVLTVTFYVLFRERQVWLATSGKWIAVGFLILFLFVPVQLLGPGYVDVRIIVAAMLIMPAFVFFSANVRWAGRLAIAFVASLVVLANTAYVAYVWRLYAADYTRLKSSFELIQRGSFVLVGETNNPEDRGSMGDPFRHAPTLAVHYAGALVPSLFAVRGAQPIKLRDEFKHLEHPALDDPVPLSLLGSIARGNMTSQTPGAIRHWPRDFDYLYLIGRPIPNPLEGILDEIARGEHFILYRIRK